MSIKWRTDEPPQKEKYYLVTYKTGSMDICLWTIKSTYQQKWGWITAMYQTVKAWMELPEPYDDTLDKIVDFIEDDETIPIETYHKLWEIIKQNDDI